MNRDIERLIERLREEQAAIIRYRQSLGAEGDYLCQEAANALESLCAGTKGGETGNVMFPPDDWVDEVMAVIGVKCSLAEATRNEIERRLRAALSEREGKPVAWIEHHKGGDNLNWEQANNNDTPLYRLSAHDERKAKG